MRVRKHGLFQLLALVAAGYFAAGALAGEAAVPQPIDLGSPDISAYIAIPDVDATFNHLDALVKAFNPQVPPGMMKMQIGMMLQDPGLANLDASKPLVLMMFKSPPDTAGGPPPLALFIPTKAASPYDQVAAQMQLVSSFKDGVLIFAKTQEALTQAQAELPAYGKIADAKAAADARIFASVKNLLATYGTQMTAGMDAMVQQMSAVGAMQGQAGGDPAAMAKIMSLEMKVLMQILTEVDAKQVDLSIKADSIAFDSLTTTVKGSALEKLLSAPAPGANRTLKLLTASGALAGTVRFNMDGYRAFANEILDMLTKDPAFTKAFTPEMKKLANQLLEIYSGDMSMSMGISPQTGMALEFAVAVTDDKKVAPLFDQLGAMMGPDGAIGKFYAAAGMKISAKVEKAVRKHSGIDVARMSYTVDTSKLPPQQAEQMKMFLKDLELAATNNVYVAANNPSDLDKLIDKAIEGDAAKPDVSLESITVFGAGKPAYFDYDVIGLLKSMMSAMPNNPAAGMFAQLKASDPIVGTANYDSGRALIQGRIPLAPFIEMSGLAKRNPAPPPPAPTPKDEKF